MKWGNMGLVSGLTMATNFKSKRIMKNGEASVFVKQIVRLLFYVQLSLWIILPTQCKNKEADSSLDWASALLTTSGFKDNKNGSVSDINTGLTWLKCTHGQAYNAPFNNCQGVGSGTVFNAASLRFCEAVVDYSITECTTEDPINPIASSGPAFDACAEKGAANYAGYSDWRLPTSEEFTALASVFDRNSLLAIFPDTPDDKYFWTASAKGGHPTGDEAYALSFATSTFGNVTLFHKTNSFLYVRCVRGP